MPSLYSETNKGDKLKLTILHIIEKNTKLPFLYLKTERLKACNPKDVLDLEGQHGLNSGAREWSKVLCVNQ